MALHINAQGKIYTAIGNPAVLPAFDYDAIQKNDRINIVERASLPGLDLLNDTFGCLADKPFRDIDPVHFKKARLNVTNAHAPGIHSEYLIVETFEIFLPFGDELRLKTAVAVPWRLETYLFGIDYNGLLASAVTGIA
jgi:hypothetical protein